MSNDQRVPIDLTPTQPREKKTEVEPQTAVAELRIEELEERIAPLGCGGTHIPEV
jgi:hypothetical protein